MDLTNSYERFLPKEVTSRYVIAETRQAAAVLWATNKPEFEELIEALNEFQIVHADLVTAGGQETNLAKRFNRSFRKRGWREARVDTDIHLNLRVYPYAPDGETHATVRTTKTSNPGYKVDNFKARVALDLEWNAKDGNLDRDLGAYRALYDAGLIDVAILVTRTMDDLRRFATRVRLDAGMPEVEAKKLLATTTTTNMDKLLPRMGRGSIGGCPLLAIAISSDTYENSPNPAQDEGTDADEPTDEPDEDAVVERVDVATIYSADAPERSNPDF